jgi:hypothetical protein
LQRWDLKIQKNYIIVEYSTSHKEKSRWSIYLIQNSSEFYKQLLIDGMSEHVEQNVNVSRIAEEE